MSAAAPRYHPSYCEENVWHLCAGQHVPAGPRVVLFVSNATRTVAFAHHRGDAMPVVWDYHVVLAARPTVTWRIWDLDSDLGLDLPLATWLSESFALPEGFGPELAPRFRAVPAADYLATLRSDRSHMRRPDGGWLSPPPPWPAIGSGGTNLATFIDVARDGPGRVADLASLADVLDTLARP